MNIKTTYSTRVCWMYCMCMMKEREKTLHVPLKKIFMIIKNIEYS